MDGNIISAAYCGTTYITTRPAWLIDYGMVLKLEGLELPNVYEVDFANNKSEKATRVLGGPDGVVIPNKFFLSDAPQIFAWLYLHAGEDDGYTKIQVTIPLSRRPDITDEQPTPEERSLIEQAIAALNTGVEDAEAWAVGERDGEPVSEGDPTYENSAKYWAEKAKTDAPVTSVNGKAGDIELNLDDIPDGETYARATPEQLAQIGTNADDIADIDAMIPSITSESNHLVNVSFLTNRLTSYRTSAAQDTIDAGKQDKITAYGILKRDRSGNITGAIAGTDYLTADALNGYRKASAQDAIDNAQNTEIGKNTAAINTMQPAATAADIGKALIVKTVADGKPTSYEYGEAGGGGGSALTAGDGIDITEDVISNTQGIEYIVGTQAASTASWKGNSTDETLKVGKIIAYYLPFAGSSSSNATLTLTMGNGAQTAAIPLRRTGTSAVTNQFAAGNVIILIYDGTYWRVSAYYDQNDNTVPSGYCLSPAATAAKAATCSYGYRGDTNYFPCLFRFANTAADATLAITTYAPEAAPIYVNGARTSASNTFSAGVILFLYYNGAYYCYNDGRFPILVNGTVTSVQEYAAGLLADYRTAAAQDEIDAGKQSKITASGILKGDGNGGVSAAAEGTDYITGLEILSYGNSTWADFLTAYTANKVVYCRASSNSNPASGAQTRLAFMAYVNDATNPTNVEFQYYRSVSSHSDSQQGDQVFVYKLDKTTGWTVTTRNTFTAIDAGNGLDKAYASGKLTLSVNSDYRTAADQDTIDAGKQNKITAAGILKGDGNGSVSAATAGTDYLAPSALEPYRTATEQDVIDAEQDERIEDLEQTTTATTIGPVALATFDASAADMPLKGLTVNIEPVQAGEGDPSPENVRSITGWTGCNINANGKNFMQVTLATMKRLNTSGVWTDNKYTYNGITFTVDTDDNGCVTAIAANGTASGDANLNLNGIASRLAPLPTNTRCRISGCPDGGSGNTYRVIAYLFHNSTYLNRMTQDIGNGTLFGSADANNYYARINIKSGVTASNLVFTPMIQLATDSSQAFEPYQGNTYDITFPDGTVYGGTLDAVNKKLTVDRAFRTYAASEVTAQGTNTGRFNIPCPTDSIDSGKWSFSSAKLPIADRAKADLSGSVNDYCIYKRYATTTYTIKLPVTALEEARTILDGLKICYYLAEPLVYDLTDVPEILTLYGENNIWADCGDVTVTYGAYLETVKKHAEVVGDSILSAIAPLEMNYTASRAYTVGSFLFVGTKFYKVTAAIASGDTITPDTNVTQTTVAEQLMTLAGN